MKRLFDALHVALRRVAEVCMAALALLTLADVLGRYVFNVSVLGAVELTEMLMVGVIFAGIVLSTARREHVAVDVLTAGFGPRARLAQQALSHLLAVVISALLGAVTWSQALSALEFGDRTTMLGLPVAPMIFFMSVMLFVNGILQLQLMWTDLRRGAAHD